MNPLPSSLAQAIQAELRVVNAFLLMRVRPRVDHVVQGAPTPKQILVQGILLRALAWMNSLAKLDAPGDFQAVVAASRTLFEMAVDLTLLHNDPSNHPAEKMLAWEESAKLKSALRAVEHFAKTGVPVPQEYEPMTRFVMAQRARIEKARAAYWLDKKGRPRHPDRWTGRTLGEDASAASTLNPANGCDEFYRATYPSRCWNTHGSGLAGVRYLDPDQITGIYALALADCTRFAVLAAELVLRELALMDREAQAEFGELHARRALTMAPAVLPLE